MAELRPGDSGVIDRMELPGDIATRLMQMGMIPGCQVHAAHVAPAGDPVVYRVDGTEIALRRELSKLIQLADPPAETPE